MNFKKTLLLLISLLHMSVALSQTLSATYVELADSADRYIRSERWQDAERVIIRALRHEPANKSNYLLWSNLGTVRLNTDNYEGALEAFNIGLASAPKSTMLLTNRARAYMALDRIHEAAADLDTALALDSTLQTARRLRGYARLADGNHMGALNDFKDYNDRFGDDAYVLVAMSRLEAMQGNCDTALSDYDKGYALQTTADLLEGLLQTAVDCGRLEDFEPQLTEGIKKWPGNGLLYAFRALLNKSRFQNSASDSDIRTARTLGVTTGILQRLGLKTN